MMARVSAVSSIDRATLSRIFPLAVAIGVFSALLVWSGRQPANEDLILLGATYTLVALGVYVPFMLAGSLSIAYLAYVGIGGYSVTLVATDTGWPVLVSFPIAMGASFVLAVILGMLTMRMSAFHLAMVTLLVSIAWISFARSADYLGGPQGMQVARPGYILGWQADRDFLVVASLVLVALAALMTSRLRNAPFGIALRGVRDVPEAVAAIGYSPTALRVLALGIGAAMASVGGALFTLANRAFSPGTFSIHVIVLAIFIPILGGTRSPVGSILGAALVVYTTFRLPGFENSGDFAFTLAVLLVLILFPKGLIELPFALRDAINKAVEKARRT